MSIHHGHILQEILKANRIKKKDFADKMGVSRQNIYTIFGREVLDGTFIDKFCKAFKIDRAVFEREIPNDSIPQNQTIEQMQQIIDSLREQLKAKDDLIRAKDEIIEMLRVQQVSIRSKAG